MTKKEFILDILEDQYPNAYYYILGILKAKELSQISTPRANSKYIIRQITKQFPEIGMEISATLELEEIIKSI